MAGSTPALIVEDVSLPSERRVVTTLAGLSAVAAEAVSGPALLIVGEAMALAVETPHPSAALTPSPARGEGSTRTAR